jgi:Ni,Fe-hydrogenase III large subunit
MKDNPYNELSDSEFLRYLAQNDYNIDGGYLPEGVRLFAAADNIKSLEIRYDELWQQYKRLAQMADELQQDNDRLYGDKFSSNTGLWNNDE